MQVGYFIYLKVNDLIIDSIESRNVIYNYKDIVFSDTEIACFNDWIQLSSAKEIIDDIQLDTVHKFPVLSILLTNMHNLNKLDKSNIHITVEYIIQLIDFNHYNDKSVSELKLIGYKVLTIPYNL